MNPTKRFKNKTYGIFRSILLVLALTVCLTGCGKRLNVVDVEPFTVSYADRYIDLHLHLDGAVTVEIAKQLAELSANLGEAMVGINADEIQTIMEERGK